MMLLRINRTVCKSVRVNVTLLTATKSTTSSDKSKNQKLIDALKNVPKRTETKSTTSSDETKNQDLFDALKNVPKPTGTRNTMSYDETKKHHSFDALKDVRARPDPSTDETKNQNLFDALKNVPKPTRTRNTMSYYETKEHHSFDALKNVRARPPKPELSDLQQKKVLNRQAAFENRFDKKKAASTVLEGLKLPKPLQSTEKSNKISLPNRKPLAPPVKTDEPTKWKKRSFLALVAEQKEDSKIFDALKAVATYSSKDKNESEDILVKMKVPEHQIHPSLLTEAKKPPQLLDQLTER